MLTNGHEKHQGSVGLSLPIRVKAPLCHHTPEAPSFFDKEQHQRGLWTLTRANAPKF